MQALFHTSHSSPSMKTRPLFGGLKTKPTSPPPPINTLIMLLHSLTTHISVACELFVFHTLMADIYYHSSSSSSSSTNDNSVDSRAEEHSIDSKLDFSEDEETLITRMYNLVGERWPLIAGRIPGRSAEEIEKYWTSRYSTSSG